MARGDMGLKRRLRVFAFYCYIKNAIARSRNLSLILPYSNEQLRKRSEWRNPGILCAAQNRLFVLQVLWRHQNPGPRLALIEGEWVGLKEDGFRV